MKHYIYPKGETGQQLGWLIEYCGEVGGGVEYIDDSIPEISFEATKEKLRKEDCVVHVALSKISLHYKKSLENISRNLKINGINFLTNSVEEYARKASLKMKNKIKKNSNTKVILMEYGGYGSDKHMGFLCEELLRRNVKVVYICSTLASFNRFSKINNLNFIFMPYVYTYLFDWVDIACSGHHYFNNLYNLLVPHCLRYYTDDNCCRVNNINMLCVAGYKFIDKNKFKGIDAIKCGYLGFDPIFKKLNKIKSQKKFIKDSVFIAPYNMEEVKILSQYIKMILSKYRVIFRYREEFQDAHLPYINEFLKNENFYIDDASGIAPESYLQSFCGIFRITSSKNTFPLLSLSPSIVLYQDSVGHGIEVDDGIGINFHKDKDPTPEEMLATIDDIYNNQEKWEESILDYREKEIYNFGHASEYLADYLVKKYDLAPENL